MKVYFIGSELDGCYNVRALFPLQANGWDGDRTTFIAYRRTPENKAKAAQDADVVVFQRPLSCRVFLVVSSFQVYPHVLVYEIQQRQGKLEMMKLLKKHGKKVVFDNDDTYKDDGGFRFNEYMNKERLEKGLGRLNDVIDQCIKEADLVTCSTEFLKKEYEQINPNVLVLPNCIDPFYFDEPLKNESDVVRIGITGSVAITSDMDILMPIVKHYSGDKRVKLVLFSMPPNQEDKKMRELYSDEYKFWESVDIEWQPFVPAEDYYTTLNELRLDMVIIPRADTLFNRCKSNLKFLENSMLEIPTIAQAFTTGDSPYQQNPDDSNYMLLANTYDEWIEQIEKLITNKELRIEIGLKAREYVENNYDIKKHAHKWKEAYEKLLNKVV